MTAIEHEAGGGPEAPHPLLRGASPAVVRSWLLAEDRERFVAEYETALDEARRSLDLTEVQAVVERWRQIAALQSNPDAFRRSVRQVAELMTGEPSPDDEPFAVTREKAGM